MRFGHASGYFTVPGYSAPGPGKRSVGSDIVGIVVEIVLVEIEIKVPAVRHLFGCEAGKLASFAFGGAPEAFPAVDEAGYSHHIQQVEFAFGRDVLHVFGHQPRAEAVFGQGENLERVCDRRLAHLHHIAAGLVPAGAFVDVRITGTCDGDLTGEIEE